MPLLWNNYITHNPCGPVLSAASGAWFREGKHRSLVVEVSIMLFLEGSSGVFSVKRWWNIVVILHHHVVPQFYLFWCLICLDFVFYSRVASQNIHVLFIILVKFLILNLETLMCFNVISAPCSWSARGNNSRRCALKRERLPQSSCWWEQTRHEELFHGTRVIRTVNCKHICLFVTFVFAFKLILQKKSGKNRQHHSTVTFCLLFL